MTVISVGLDALYPNPWQPRRQMHDDDVAALADNIAAIGRVLHTPNVRANPLIPDTYQIAEGHQRIEALRVLYELECGWPNEATVNVEDFSDVQMAEIALSENDQRTDISALDQLYAWKAALDIDDMNVTRLAATASVDRTTIQKRLPVLSLPDVVLEHVDSGALGIDVAREFVPLMNHDHTHDDVIEYVVDRARRADSDPDYGLDPHDYKNAIRRTDFRRHRIREFINDGVKGSETLRKGWRLVDTVGKHYFTPPTFDLEAFRKEHELYVHRLPSENVAESALWTCATKQWTKAQTESSRARNAAKPKESKKKPEKQVSRWLAQVRRDPVVVAVLGSKRRAAQLGNMEPESDLGRNVIDDVFRERLGERIKHGKGIELPRAAYQGKEAVRTRNLGNAEIVPGFDYDECQTCPMAGYQAWSWTDPNLVCRDKKRYANKKSLAIEAWNAAFKKAKQDAQIDDLNAEHALRNMLLQVDPNTLTVVLRSLSRAVRDLPHVDAVPGYPKASFWPQPALDLAKLLDLELPPVNSQRYDAADVFRKQAADAIVAANQGTRVVAAALMGAWANRISWGLDVGGVAGPHPSQNGAHEAEEAAVEAK